MFTCHEFLVVTVKEMLKSVYFCQKLSSKISQGCHFFGPPCIKKCLPQPQQPSYMYLILIDFLSLTDVTIITKETSVSDKVINVCLFFNYWTLTFHYFICCVLSSFEEIVTIRAVHWIQQFCCVFWRVSHFDDFSVKVFLVIASL